MSQVQSQDATTNAPIGMPAEGKAFFDLHVNGVGYLNRIREVKPRKGQPFLACSVSAMRGEPSDVEYTKFDLRVTGSEARRIVAMLKPEVDGKRPVVIGFRIGDIYPELFTYERGEKAGQPGVAIKGRLLKIGFAKVDGQAVTLPGTSDQTGTDVPAQ
jgi:hypothetical protein